MEHAEEESAPSATQLRELPCVEASLPGKEGRRAVVGGGFKPRCAVLDGKLAGGRRAGGRALPTGAAPHHVGANGCERCGANFDEQVVPRGKVRDVREVVEVAQGQPAHGREDGVLRERS